MPIKFQTDKLPDQLEPRHDQAATNVSLDLTAARTSNSTTKCHSLSLLRSLDGNPGAKAEMNALHALCFAKANGVITEIPSFQSSLFSSSLPELYSRNMETSSRNTHIDHSLDTVPRDINEEEHFKSLEEIEAQTIGNLLPNDDDLFGGVSDGLNCFMQPNGGDMEELDLFYNVGGMDFECDFSRGQKYAKSGTNGSTRGKQPTSKKEINQGILIVSNLDSSVSNDSLQNIFCAYGDIKEIQSAPRGNHQKLIEYFDSRAAEAALHALNGSKIAGKQIKLEPVTYRGIKDLLKHSIELQQSALQIPYLGSTLQNGISSSLPSLDNKTDLSTGQLKVDTWGSPNFHPRSLGDYHDGFMNGFQTYSNPSQQLHKFTSNGHSPEQDVSVFESAVNGSSPLNGPESIWSNSCHFQPPGTMCPNSLSYMNGVHGSSSTMLLALNNHHVGPAPAVNSTIWDRHQPYTAAGSPEKSVFHPRSWWNTGISRIPPHSVDFVPHNMYPYVSGNCMDLPMPSTAVVGFHSSSHQRCMMFPGRGQRLPGLCSYEPPSERVRSRKSEGASAEKKQFELDIERIIRGEVSRTTLMIKNIPNKYTSKMLLAAIDENCRGTYDFIYLPIDFKNKCNVGYAFINMTDPSHIIPFYKTFNGKKWEKFNSEKVASLAYARIQGKSALISHFQSSSLMNEDKRCRPILFNTEGLNAGDQVPFPMGVDGRSRAGKTRSISLEEKSYEEAIGGEQSF